MERSRLRSCRCDGRCDGEVNFVLHESVEMPPRRRPERFQLGLNGQELYVIEERKVASRHMTNLFWEMKKELGHEDTCCVCLESVMTCKSCFCLLACAHTLHYRCFIDLENQECPVCRS